MNKEIPEVRKSVSTKFGELSLWKRTIAPMLGLSLIVACGNAPTGEELVTTTPTVIKPTITLQHPTASTSTMQGQESSVILSEGEWDVQPPPLDLPRSIPKGTSHDLKPREIPQITEDFEKNMLDVYIGGDRWSGEKVETGFLKIKDYGDYQVALVSGYLVGYHEARFNDFYDFSANPPTMSYITLAGRNSDGSVWIKRFILGKPNTDVLALWNHYSTEELIEDRDQLRREAIALTDMPISEIGDQLENRAFWFTSQVVIEIPISVNTQVEHSDLFEAGAKTRVDVNQEFLDSFLTPSDNVPNEDFGWVTGIHTFT